VKGSLIGQLFDIISQAINTFVHSTIGQIIILAVLILFTIGIYRALKTAKIQGIRRTSRNIGAFIVIFIGIFVFLLVTFGAIAWLTKNFGNYLPFMK
jgi:hypothetical protein